MTRPAEISLVSGFALGRLVLLGGAVALALFVGAAGYGYHRDELYFLVAGDHLAWGYADQGPLTPFIAHVMDGVAPGSEDGFGEQLAESRGAALAALAPDQHGDPCVRMGHQQALEQRLAHESGTAGQEDVAGESPHGRGVGRVSHGSVS